MNHNAIIQRLKSLPGHISVVLDKQDTHFEYNADYPHVAASIIKLPILCEAFRRFEEGSLNPKQLISIREQDKYPSCGALTYLHNGVEVTLLDLCTLMIILSDNTATNLLIDLLGMDQINRMIHSLGLKHTRLNRRLFDSVASAAGIENFVSCSDMALLLRLISSGKVISQTASAQMLDILSKQRLNGKIPFFLAPNNIRCAHKTGEDEHITHDVAIALTDEHPILCFLCSDTDVPQAQRMIQDLSRDFILSL